MSESQFHADGTKSWESAPETLAWIADNVRPGQATVETGSGASTIAFIRAGARHTAISPAPDEHDRIRAFCAAEGLPLTQVRFLPESSDDALPRLVATGERVQVALVDGKHAFPLPAVDYHYLERMLEVGGALILDDAPIRSVKVVHRFLESSAAWRPEAVLDDRTVLYRKVEDAPAREDWPEQRMNRIYPDWWYLPPVRRARLTGLAVGSAVKRRLQDRPRSYME